MQTSENINELATALATAQSQIVPPEKNCTGARGSKYADLANVIKAVIGPLNQNGISFTQMPFSHNNIVGVTTRLMHTSGQWLESSLSIPVAKAHPWEYGSNITYCRRYTLASICGCAADDDTDGMTDGVAELDNRITAEQAISLEAMLELNNYPLEQVLAKKKISALVELSVADYKQMITAMTKAKEQKE